MSDDRRLQAIRLRRLTATNRPITLSDAEVMNLVRDAIADIEGIAANCDGNVKPHAMRENLQLIGIRAKRACELLDALVVADDDMQTEGKAP